MCQSPKSRGNSSKRAAALRAASDGPRAVQHAALQQGRETATATTAVRVKMKRIQDIVANRFVVFS